MTRQLPHRKILKVLDEQFGGQIVAVGRDDIVMKLASALGERSSGSIVLYQTLRTMADEGKVELRYNERRVDRIALPGVEKPGDSTAQDKAPSQEETQEGTDMAAPRRRHYTTSPRTAQGEPLPYVLKKDQVSELQVSHPDPDVEKEIIAAAELVVEELRSYNKRTIKRSEMLAMIVTLLGELGHTVAAAKTLSTPVLGRMCHAGWLPVHRRLDEDTVYSLKLPEVQAPAKVEANKPPSLDLSRMTPEEAIVALVKKVEELKQSLTTTTEEKGDLERQCAELRLHLLDHTELQTSYAKLQKDLETARAEAAAKPQIDEQMVQRLTDKITELRTRNTNLEEAASEAARRHKDEMLRLKTTHSRAAMDRDEAHNREKRSLEEELDAARRKATELQQELDTKQQAPTPAAMGNDLLGLVNDALRK